MAPELLGRLCKAPVRDRKHIVIARELIELGANIHQATNIQSKITERNEGKGSSERKE